MTGWMWHSPPELRACIWGESRWPRGLWCAGVAPGMLWRIFWSEFHATVYRRRAKRRARGRVTFFLDRYLIRRRSGGWANRRAAGGSRRFAAALRFRWWRLAEEMSRTPRNAFALGRQALRRFECFRRRATGRR